MFQSHCFKAIISLGIFLFCCSCIAQTDTDSSESDFFGESDMTVDVVPEKYVRILDVESYNRYVEQLLGTKTGNRTFRKKKKNSEKSRNEQLYIYCATSIAETDNLDISVISPDLQIAFSNIRIWQGGHVIYDGKTKDFEGNDNVVRLMSGSTMAKFQVNLDKKIWTDWQNAYMAAEKDHRTFIYRNRDDYCFVFQVDLTALLYKPSPSDASSLVPFASVSVQRAIDPKVSSDPKTQVSDLVSGENVETDCPCP